MHKLFYVTCTILGERSTITSSKVTFSDLEEPACATQMQRLLTLAGTCNTCTDHSSFPLCNFNSKSIIFFQLGPNFYSTQDQD